jgi:hypothetical protein
MLTQLLLPIATMAAESYFTHLPRCTVPYFTHLLPHFSTELLS